MINDFSLNAMNLGGLILLLLCMSVTIVGVLCKRSRVAVIVSRHIELIQLKFQHFSESTRCDDTQLTML